MKLLKLSKNRTAVYPPFPSMSSPPTSCPVTFFCSFYAVFVYLLTSLSSLLIFPLVLLPLPIFFIFFVRPINGYGHQEAIFFFFFFKEKRFGDKEARAFVKTE